MAINIVLFPDLRFDATERNPGSGAELEEEGAFFPDIISTIGFAICRPLHGTFLSVVHKRGFDEVVQRSVSDMQIGVLLTLLLDNKRWLFQVSIVPLCDVAERRVCRCPSACAVRTSVAVVAQRASAAVSSALRRLRVGRRDPVVPRCARSFRARVPTSPSAQRWRVSASSARSVCATSPSSSTPRSPCSLRRPSQTLLQRPR